MFSKLESDYLKTQLLVRLGTVSKAGQPDVSPVGFEFDGHAFWIGSREQASLKTTRKYVNVHNGNRKVALVFDDLASVEPWHPRGIKVHGIAEIADHVGRFGSGEYLKVTPLVSWSWGLDVAAGRNRVKTIHT